MFVGEQEKNIGPFPFYGNALPMSYAYVRDARETFRKGSRAL